MKYEILGNNQVKIIEEKVETTEQVVDISAVQKRKTEIEDQMSQLQEELDRWNAVLSATEGHVIVSEINNSIKLD